MTNNKNFLRYIHKLKTGFNYNALMECSVHFLKIAHCHRLLNETIGNKVSVGKYRYTLVEYSTFK